ncbi:hypothetical protein NEN27_23260 [Escherichia coli]|nr:hypothetical protein [Escherichia coli]
MSKTNFKTERGIITFFDLEMFGLYKIRQGKSPELVEKNLSHVLCNLHSWICSRTVEQSVPWGKDNNRRTKAYCKNISYDSMTGDYLFVIWKTLGDNSGNIQGIDAESKIDGTSDNVVSASDTQGGGKYIWGVPCYYWVIPEYNKIASIRFPSSNTDTDLFCHYIKAYVDFRMEHPNKKVIDMTRPRNDSPEDVHYKRVLFSQGDDESLVFKVQTKQTRMITSGANIEELCKKITHIVYHDVIETNIPDTREKWQKLFDAVGDVFSRSSPILSKKHRVELLVEGTPTPEEFTKLIDEYIENHNPISEDTENNNENVGNDHARIGFKINGKNGSTTWLDEYVYRHEIHVDLSNRNKHYSSSYLMSVVKAHRNDLVNCFKNEDIIEQPEADNDTAVQIHKIGA